MDENKSNAMLGISNLSEPLQRIWSDGRSVLAYPDGTVLDRATGRVIKQGKNLNTSLLTFLLQLMIRSSSEISYWDTQIVNIAANNTAQQVVTTSKPTKFVRVRAAAANAGTVYLGGANVSDTNSTMPLAANAVINIALTDLSLLYVYGAADDKIVYTITQ